MWYMVIISVILALTGHLSLTAEANQLHASAVRSHILAGEMAAYRNAVIAYFTANPSQFNTVNLASLRSINAVPSWSPLNSDLAPERWTNYRSSDGTIYVYATSPLNDDVAAHLGHEITQLSGNSLLTGIFRTGDTSLFSPVFGHTGIPLPAAVTALIPNGSPIWIAMRD